MIDAVLAAAADLLQRIKDTNTVTVDWLLTHRVALPDADYLDSNALLGRYNRLDVEPTSISGDPLYLLTCHIHDILETVECVGDVDHPVLEVLETQLARILTTVENEITSAQAFNTALISARTRHALGRRRLADATMRAVGHQRASLRLPSVLTVTDCPTSSIDSASASRSAS